MVYGYYSLENIINELEHCYLHTHKTIDQGATTKDRR